MIFYGNASTNLDLDENQLEQHLSSSSLSANENSLPESEFHDVRDSFNDELSCSNAILQHVHENSPELPTVNNNSCGNSRLT